MSPKNPQQAPAPRREIYYKVVRFCPDFVMSLGMSYASAVGDLTCSTTEHKTRYSARWIPGSAVLSIRWLTQQGKLIEYDVPWTKVMGATRIPEGEEPAPLG